MQKLDPLSHTAKKHPFIPKKLFPIVVIVFVVMILLGVGTGYLLTGGSVSSGSITAQVQTSASGKKTFGSADTKTFSDSAVGKVAKGGIDGEGTHTLIRDGGPTQTACLVSSVLDLDEFVGKTVKVWGNTNTAKNCPWLMDVGRVELQ